MEFTKEGTVSNYNNALQHTIKYTNSIILASNTLIKPNTILLYDAIPDLHGIKFSVEDKINKSKEACEDYLKALNANCQSQMKMIIDKHATRINTLEIQYREMLKKVAL